MKKTTSESEAPTPAVIDLEHSQPAGTPAAVPSQEAEMAEQLTAQFKRAKATSFDSLLQSVICGAMMLHLRHYLEFRPTLDKTQARRGPSAKGKGLDTWLAKNAPEVSRSTAYNWMALAEGLLREFKLEANADLPKLLSGPSEELSKKAASKQKKILAFLEGKSQRQLQMVFGEKARGGDNTPRDEDGNALVNTPTPEEALAKITNETREWAEIIVTGKFTRDKLWRAMADEENLNLAITLEEQAAAIRAWLKTPARDRAALALADLHP